MLFSTAYRIHSCNVQGARAAVRMLSVGKVAAGRSAGSSGCCPSDSSAVSSSAVMAKSTVTIVLRFMACFFMLRNLLLLRVRYRRSAHAVRFGQSFPDFHVHPVRKPRDDFPPFERLLFGPFRARQHMDVGFVPFEF